MDNRIRYLDKLLVWMMSFVMLVPTLLGFVGSLTTYAAASTTDNIVDAVLYDGPDGLATVQAAHDSEGQKIDWTVTLNKNPTESLSYLQLDIDVSGSGLNEPSNVSSNVILANNSGVINLKAPSPTLEADNRVVTFSTIIADATIYDFSLKMLVQVIGEATSLATIQSSPLTKVINFSVPQPPQEVEQESSEVIESIPPETVESEVIEPATEESKVEESLPPADEESSSEVIEEVTSEEVIEEAIPDEVIEETKSEEATDSKESTPEESSEPEEKSDEVSPSPVAPEIEEDTPDEEVDPTIAEPVSKTYIAKSFPIPFVPAKRMLRTADLPGSVSVDKTAEACEGCRTYEVTLDITGVPPVKPVDVVLILDKSGSMSESTDGYFAISSAPSTNRNYYVKVNGQFVEVSYTNGNWRYGSF
ncbi:hypothetical protein, partial [Jeotgalibaca porci]|uniref:hypothetical protein n=1 Tax=Jeotgalibaca porci TaxID=1868793 RepID=UPI0035A1D28E